LDRVEIKAALKQKKALSKANAERKSKLTKHEKSIRTQDEIKQGWLDSIILLPCGLTLNRGNGMPRLGLFRVGLDFHRKEKDALGMAVADADYSDYGGVSNLEKGGELGEINVNAFLDGKQLHVYAKSVAAFLKSPTSTTVRDAFSQLCHMKKDLDIACIKRLFGGHAKDALFAYFDKDEEGYSAVVNKRIGELREEMAPLFDQLQRVKWRMVDPGAQAIGSMRPVKITAREGYGELYSPFICSYAWTAKMTIISAFKRKSQETKCLLVKYLGRDLLKLIFLHVDLLYTAEQSAVYSAWCCEDNLQQKQEQLAYEAMMVAGAEDSDDEERGNIPVENSDEEEYWRGAAHDFDDYPYDQ
jgi:hypothetical protein